MHRSKRIGLIASLGLLSLYAVVVGGASGSVGHLLDQVRADWYFILPLTAGFGVQVGLMSELRRRQRLHMAAMGMGVAGAGASTVGMVACCAHHIADLAPFLGASAAATFLTSYKVAFVVVGLVVNALGIGVTLTRLRRLPAPPSHEEQVRCAV